MCYRLFIYLGFWASGLYAHETNAPVDKPSVTPVQSEHYEIWSADGVEHAQKAGQALEQLRQDFSDTFVGRIGPRLPEHRLTALLVRDELQSYPGMYDPVNKWSVVDMGLCKFPANKWITILRHEATHQLFHHTYAIPIVRGDNSFWYREGVACYFEGGGKFRLNGPVRLMRLGMLEATYKEDVLPPIADLVRRQPGNLGGGNSALDYALAWSFVHFLMHGNQGAYREQFFGFLENLRGWNQQKRGNKLFLASFPDLDVLHRDWSLHVALLQRGTESELSTQLDPIGRVPHQAPDEASRTLIPKVEPAATPAAPKVNEVRAAYKQLNTILNGPEADWEPRLASELFGTRNGLNALRGGFAKVDVFTRRRVIDAIDIGRHRPALSFLIQASLRDSDAGIRKHAAGVVREFTYGVAPKAYFDLMRGQSAPAMHRVVDALQEIGDPFAIKYLVALLTSVGSRVDRTQPAQTANRFERSGSSTLIRPGTRALRDAGPTRLMGRDEVEQAMAEAVIETLQSLTGETMTTQQEWLAWAAKKLRP